jgi:hypothetical protein
MKEEKKHKLVPPPSPSTVKELKKIKSRHTHFP